MRLFPAALLVFGLCLAAQEARVPISPVQKQEAIVKLLKTIQFESVSGALAGMMFTQLGQQAKTDEERKVLGDLESRYRREALNLAAEAYGKNFTYTEIVEMQKFYDSPAGKSFLEKQPKVEADIGALAQAWMMKTLREIDPANKPQ